MTSTKTTPSVTDRAYIESAAQGLIDSLAHYGRSNPAAGDSRMATPAWYANRLSKVLHARGDQLPATDGPTWWGDVWETYARQLLAEIAADQPASLTVAEFVRKLPCQPGTGRVMSTWMRGAEHPDEQHRLLDAARDAGLVERVYVGRSMQHDDHDRLTAAGAALREETRGR